jgi:hypothetical protein
MWRTPRQRAPQALEQTSSPVAVLNRGRGDDDDEQQTDRVDDDMALGAADLLPRVIPPRGLPDRVWALDRLGVGDPRRRRWLAALPLGGNLLAQRVVQRVERAVRSERQRLTYP